MNQSITKIGKRLRSYVNRMLDLPLGILNSYFDRYTGGDNRPAFFNIDTTFPALHRLTEHYAEIRKETESVLRDKSTMIKYHELDLSQLYISHKYDRDKEWNVVMLNAMGERWEKNCALCPKTSALLDEIPDLFQAFLSVLEAGKSVPGHRGKYRGYLRFHLGLKVPKKNPPSLRVKDTWYQWEEGKAILFDDSLHHEVVNKANEDRIVLIVDVLRPMPPAAQYVNRLFSRTVVRFVYAKGVFNISPMIWRLIKSFSNSQ